MLPRVSSAHVTGGSEHQQHLIRNLSDSLPDRRLRVQRAQPRGEFGIPESIINTSLLTFLTRGGESDSPKSDDNESPGSAQGPSALDLSVIYEGSRGKKRVFLIFQVELPK